MEDERWSQRRWQGGRNDTHAEPANSCASTPMLVPVSIFARVNMNLSEEGRVRRKMNAANESKYSTGGT